MLDTSLVDDVVRVEEADTLRACHRLARGGFLFGGSTGTVVSGAEQWLDRHGSDGTTAVAISPDLGERYLDTVYQRTWVQDLFGERALRPDEGAEVERAVPRPRQPESPSPALSALR
jgi:cysteine synthase A